MMRIKKLKKKECTWTHHSDGHFGYYLSSCECSLIGVANVSDFKVCPFCTKPFKYKEE